MSSELPASISSSWVMHLLYLKSTARIKEQTTVRTPILNLLRKLFEILQEMAMLLERERKLVEAQVKDLHARLDEAENNALKVKTSTLTILVYFHTVFKLGFFHESSSPLYYANAHRYFNQTASLTPLS
jgi:uncharacterized protein YlxW (UPF0749 family)